MANRWVSVGVCVLAGLCRADDLHWNRLDANGGLTGEAANWQEGVAPQEGDNLFFDREPAKQRTVLVNAVADGVASFGTLSGALGYPWWVLNANGWALELSDAADFSGVVDASRADLSSQNESLSFRGAGRAVVPNLVASYGTPIAVADAGGRLVVSNFYHDAVVEKTGAGTLEVVRSDGAATRLAVQEGTLAFNPPADDGEVVGDPYIHVSADRLDSLVVEAVGGTNFVTRWNDVRGAEGRPCFTTTADNPEAPSLRPAGGLYARPVMDFGCFVYRPSAPVAVTGDVARLGMPASLQLSRAASDVREVFAVVADTECQPPAGGKEMVQFLFGADGAYHFHRNLDAPRLFSSGNASPFVVAGDIRVNDAGALPGAYAFGSALRVVSVGTAGNVTVGCIGRDRNRLRLGGIRYGEILVYTNALTQLERTKVNRYLMKRWLRAGERGDWQADRVTLAAGTALEVADGKTAAVRTLELEGGELVKKGGGTLELASCAPARIPSVTLAGGALKLRAREAADEAAPAPAADPYLRFDADDLASFDVEKGAGDDARAYVTRWRDATLGSTRHAVAGADARPWVVEGACNGRRVLDFGTWLNGLGAPFMEIRKREGERADLPWLRELFLVYRYNPYKNGTEFSPFLIGGSGYENFHWGYGGRLMNEQGNAYVGYAGKWRVDGVCVPPTTRLDTNAFHVVSLALGQNLENKFYIMNDRHTLRTGGAQVAEIIGYNRRLTERERHDTEAYLLAKWKSAPHPADAEQTVSVGTLTCAEGVAARLASDGDLRVETVFADGSRLVTEGTGSVTVASTSARTLEVASGTLVFAGESVKPVYHVDAAAIDPADIVTENGTNFVTRWADVRGTGPAAVTNGVTGRPYLRTDEKSGRPVVDFGPLVLGEKGGDVRTAGSLIWDQTVNVREVILVAGDHDDVHDSAFFLNGAGGYKWHRGDDGKLFSSGFAAENVRNGRLELNGQPATCETKLPNGLSILSVAITNGAAVPADRWANDRGTIRVGGVVIGEARVYDQVLGEAARAHVVGELAWKWFGEAAPSVEMDAYEVAAGAELVATNQSVAVGEVAGGGTIRVRALSVTGEVRPEGALRVCAPAGMRLEDGAAVRIAVTEEGAWGSVQIEGPLVLAGGGTVVVDLPASVRLRAGERHVLLAASSLAAPAWADWKIGGTLLERFGARLVRTETSVDLVVNSLGTLLLLR